MSSGGGGGGTSTTQTSNIPDWMRPQVETLLGGATQELFNVGWDGQILGAKPYTPYSTNMKDYVAGFSPLQQQVQANVANLRVPQQFQVASILGQNAGVGAQQSAQQNSDLGKLYERLATTPAEYQRYMSPYQQLVVDQQVDAARRQDDISRTQRQTTATKAGAFGGARQAIEEAEAARALQSNLAGIQAKGSQDAYSQAQQNITNRVNFEQQGLAGAQTGYGTALQSAQALGQLGAQQLGAQQSVLGMQNEVGAQQQGLEQQKINQAIGNFAQTQTAPMSALQNYNSLIRGYASPGVTTTQYQAAPNAMSQLAGAGTFLAGASGVMGKKKGGLIKGGSGIERLALRKAVKGE